MFKRRWELWRFLLIWLVLLGLLFFIAAAKRESWGEAKAAVLTQQLQSLYWGAYGDSVYLMVTRPKIEYLIFNRGMLTPELAEALLIREGSHCEQFQPRAAIIEHWPLQVAMLAGCQEQMAADPYLQALAGFLCFRAGKDDRALEFWGNYIEKANWYSDAHRGAYFELLTYYGRDAEAEELLKGELRKFPDSIASNLAYACWLLDGDRCQEAIALLKNAKAEYLPTYKEYWQYLAEGYLRLGQVEEYKRLLIAEIQQPEVTGNHGKPTWTASWWGDWLGQDENLDQIKGLSAQQRLLYNLDPHLAIMEGHFDVADIYFHGYNDQWYTIFNTTLQPKLLAILEQDFQTRCETFLKEHSKLNEPMADPDIVCPKDWHALRLLSCYSAIGAWDKARELDGQFCVPDNFQVGAERQRARLLYTLAAGGDVSKLNLRRLREGGDLPKLLRSKQFHDLLEQGGYDHDTVLAQIREVSRPWRRGEPNTIGQGQ